MLSLSCHCTHSEFPSEAAGSNFPEGENLVEASGWAFNDMSGVSPLWLSDQHASLFLFSYSRSWPREAKGNSSKLKQDSRDNSFDIDCDRVNVNRDIYTTLTPSTQDISLTTYVTQFLCFLPCLQLLTVLLATLCFSLTFLLSAKANSALCINKHQLLCGLLTQKCFITVWEW